MDGLLLAVAIVVPVVLVIILAVLGYFWHKKRKVQVEGTKDEKQKFIRHRPSPLKLDHVRITRQPSQLSPRPLLITPTSPNQFFIPSRCYNDSQSRTSSMSCSPEDPMLLSTSPQSADFPSNLESIKLFRAMSEGAGVGWDREKHRTPHGKIKCFLKHDCEINCLNVEILGKKGHSLSWLTGISNPYIRVSLLSNDAKECNAVLATQTLNLPLNPKCQLNGLTKENIKDCFLKFVVLDFDRFSRSEFVAEVLITLGDLENLSDGVTVCEDLILQQKVMLAPRGSFLISLCNQSVGQQLQVIIMKADGISFKGKDLYVRTTLETTELCYKRKSKGSRKNSSYIFNEKLVFDVNTEDLTNANLVLEVSKGDSRLLQDTKLGYVKLGLGSNMALEIRHWSEMLASPQKQIAEWHQLHHR